MSEKDSEALDEPPIAQSKLAVNPIQNPQKTMTLSSGSTISTTSCGSSSTCIGPLNNNSSHVSEKVALLASAIYKELETVISQHGEENFRVLLSLVINALESLDVAWQDKQQFETDNELLREDREQLLTQWQRAMQLKQFAEQKYAQLEDFHEEQKNGFEENIAKLINKIKSRDIKIRNQNEQIIRIEEKGMEHQRDLCKLRERYAELFKQHYEHLHGTGSFRHSQYLDSPFALRLDGNDNPQSSVSDGSISSKTPLEFGSLDINKESMDFDDNSYETFRRNDRISRTLNASMICRTKDYDRTESKASNCSEDEFELTFEDGTISTCDLGDTSVQRSLFGMTREVDKLISENAELIETKNALNILKNDLIQRIEELSTQLEVGRDDWAAAIAEKQKYKSRVSELEKEIDVLRTDINLGQDSMDDHGTGDKRFFTREEICRVLNEKNKYKQMYMELEDAIKCQNAMRFGVDVNVEHDKIGKRTRIWHFFSTLLSGSANVSNVMDSGIETMSRSNSYASSISGIRSKLRSKMLVEFPDHPVTKVTNLSISGRSLENHWFTPESKMHSQKVPIFCCSLEKCFKGAERFYMSASCVCPDTNENFWWVVLKKSSPTSKVMVLGNPDIKDEIIEIKKSFDVDDQLIVGCICFIPGTNLARENEDFDSDCEFCRRDKETGKRNEHDQKEDLKLEKCTAWLGGQHGSLTVYDARTAEPIDKLQLEHTIFSMIYHHGRLLCGLSNGTIVILHRNRMGFWPKNPQSPFIHRISLSSSGHNAIRVLCGVSNDQCWCGIRNQIYVLDKSLTILNRLDVSPRQSKTNQIRFICTTYCDRNVSKEQKHTRSSNPLAFVAVRWTSSVYVYDVYTRKLLQDVDVDPLERSVIGTSWENKTGLMLVKITFIHVVNSQLWVGTNNGNVICLNIEEDKEKAGLIVQTRLSPLTLIHSIDKAFISAECHLSEVELIASGLVQLTDSERRTAVISFGIGSQTLAPCPVTHPPIPTIKDLCGAEPTGLLWLID